MTSKDNDDRKDRKDRISTKNEKHEKLRKTGRQKYLLALFLSASLLLAACADGETASGSQAMESLQGEEKLQTVDSPQAENSPQAKDSLEENTAQKSDGALQEKDLSLNVAIFPYVPDPQRFQSVIEEEWSRKHPEVPLVFHEWDCYEEKEVEDTLDVVTFDAIFLTEYAKNNELLEINAKDISDSQDILSFVSEGTKVDGSLYGIPQMICANLFFYRTEDTDLANVNNVEELYDVIGDNNSAGERPENGKGLLVDMSSGTGNICLYLDAIIDTRAVYTDFTEMPDLEKINEQAVEGLNLFILMAGRTQAYYYDDNDAYIRAKWFGEGSGKAYIGYSESMARMSQRVSEITVKTMSLANREDIPLFYVDMVAANSRLADEPQKKELAIELINLMTDRAVMTRIIGGEDGKTPQYILPARNQCYTDLQVQNPIYNQLKEVVGKDGNYVFRMGDNAHDYIVEAKKILPHYLLK